MNTNKKTALITGASSGIGYEFCKIFAENGFNLVITARSEDKLTKFASKLTEEFNVDVKTIPADLSIPSEAQKLFDESINAGMRINVLINNAGFGMRGKFVDLDLKKQLNMIDLNMRSLTELTYLFANEMIKSGGGKILNVASTAGFQPGPLMAVYYASKAFVLNFSEAVANELKDKNVSVTVVCPGPTETQFQKTAGMEGTNLFRNNFVMTAEEVAALGYKGLMKGKTLVIAGKVNKVLAFSSRLAPRKMAASVTRMLHEKRK